MNENPRPQFVTALLLALLAIISFGAHAETILGEKGCYFTYYSHSGEVRFEPFLKVADKDWSSEDGEPEIWGYRPHSGAARDENDRPMKVNVLAARFVPLGKIGRIPAGSTERSVRCPAGFW